MRIAIVGQRDFGKVVFEAFVSRGDTVAGVFCEPEGAGEPPDALRVAAESRLPPSQPEWCRQQHREMNDSSS